MVHTQATVINANLAMRSTIQLVFPMERAAIIYRLTIVKDSGLVQATKPIARSVLPAILETVTTANALFARSPIALLAK